MWGKLPLHGQGNGAHHSVQKGKLMHEDAHLESMFDDRSSIEDESDYNARDFDDFEEDGCEGHYDDDFALTAGNLIGEPYYCDGSCV